MARVAEAEAAAAEAVKSAENRKLEFGMHPESKPRPQEPLAVGLRDPPGVCFELQTALLDLGAGTGTHGALKPHLTAGAGAGAGTRKTDSSPASLLHAHGVDLGGHVTGTDGWKRGHVPRHVRQPWPPFGHMVSDRQLLRSVGVRGRGADSTGVAAAFWRETQPAGQAELRSISRPFPPLRPVTGASSAMIKLMGLL